jgi:hypothetical protein
MRFVMAKRGSVFSTQDRAIRLLAELEQEEAAARSAGDSEFILDFDGVDHIGSSFATAFVGRVFAERREAELPKPQIEGDNENVRAKIQAALSSGERLLAA